VPDPTAQPTLSLDPPSTWLLGPVELAAIRADDRLIDLLAAGERPNLNDSDPAVRLLAAWLVEVVDGGAAR
jgi:hypothetical protein